MADLVRSGVDKPFPVHGGRLCTHVRSIAVLPPAFAFPRRLPHEDAVKSRIEAAIFDTLTALGYTAVPSGTVQQALRGLISLRDPGDGPPSERAPGRRPDSLKQECLRELRRALLIDAILYPEIVVVQAVCNGGIASWYGAVQKVYTPCKALLELMSAPACSKVPALSILVHIHDMEDSQIYINAAGIEVLQMMGVGRLIDVPARRLLKNGLRNRRAVQGALAGLRGTGDP